MSDRVAGALCCLAALLALAPTAQALDHCAPPTPAQPGALGIELDLRLEHAEYSTESYAGNYSGIALAATYTQPIWDVALEVPVYQLLKNGLDVGGPGDPYLRGRIQIFESTAETVALGALLGLSAPLGNAEDDLGMGHFMLHPGLWLRAGQADVHGEWTLGYGRVLSSEQGHGTGPLVNPMNASEFSVAGALVWRLWRGLDLRASGLAAVPVPAAGGEARATVGLGAGLLLGKVAVSSGFSLPVLGDPYDAKIELAVSYGF